MKNIIAPIAPRLVIDEYKRFDSWEDWLSETETHLIELGYKKFNQNNKRENFSYWKTYKNGEENLYQIGILFYDLRNYTDHNPTLNRIGIMYDCMLIGEDRIDLTVNKNIDLWQFEKMVQTFYGAMYQYC